MGLILIGVAPAAADGRSPPRSLRMRAAPSSGSSGSVWSPMRWARRIAQADGQPAPSGDQPAPSGDQPAPSGDQPAPSGEQPAAPSGDQPAAPAQPAQPQGQPEAPAASASQQKATGLSDEELAKLAEQEAKTEVITVTGSLISRREVDSPSPVSVVDREKLVDAGVTNVGDVLQKIPAQGNAINAQNNNGGDGSTRINLRSLGTQRTLVLLNGRRVVSSGLGADDSVDFGTIPLAMVERVEVLKDGASAIYGSDAIAGVVNVITRTNMNGTEADIQTSTSTKGDGTNYDLSFVTGHSSDRGNITFSGGYQNQKPIMASERDFSKQTYSYDFTCTSAMAAAGECTPATLTGSPSGPTGRINTMPNAGAPLSISGCNTQFCTADGNGGFRNFIPASGSSFGDNYNFQTLNYVLTPSTRVNLFSNGHYDITKNTHAFFEGQFNSRKSEQQLAEEPISTALTDTPISRDSLYNPFGQDVADYSRRLTEFGVRSASQDVNTARMVVGLNGNLPDDVPTLKNWKWEASYNYGRTDATNATHGDLILSHLRDALGPSFRDATGVHCGTAGNVIDGCTPLSLLVPGTVSKDAIDYLTFTGTTAGFNEQHTALATTSGKLLDLPNHGDVSLALGADYRFERGGFQPDPLTATGDTTGNAAAPTLGSYHTFEGFGELSVVPYSGGELLKWVEVNAAGRAYDYNTFGNGITGKVSGLVRTAGGIALRGTYGTAFRAPNIGELFAGQFDSFQNLSDPCDTLPPGAKKPVALDPMTQRVCSGTTQAGGVPVGSVFSTIQQRAKLGGNPQLDPEKGAVGTAGVVYEPVTGMAFTLDYWHINIDNAITTLPAATVLSQCYQAGVDKFCNDIVRDPMSHTISHIFDLTQNVGSRTTSGLDFSASYQYRLAALGTLRHSVEGTYLFMNNIDTGTVDPTTGKEQILHGRGFFDLGVNPDLKFNVFTTWRHPSGLGGGFAIRFVDSFQECDNDNCNDPTNGRRQVSKYADGDVFLDYGIKTSQGTTQIAIGANNVANTSPPLIYDGAVLNSDESAYSFMGRQFYVRLSQIF
ncbi:MAG TPA: TonB-dependent receptor [Kofleriaceae bacterium]|nr:TonB-dependent receptor [Kofleriaceae bacterium]